jgi:hypothetical protein
MGEADAGTGTSRVWCRRRTCAVMAVALLVSVVDSAIAAAGGTPTGPQLRRVRPHGETLRAAVDMGLDRSATLRRLHDAIDASDGMVYVIEGTCLHSVHACLMLRVWTAGPFRLLLIMVDSSKAEGCELAGLIAHELQHAVEVLAEPGVRSDAAIYSLFDRIGRTGSGRFETQEAMEVQLTVRDEACRAD